MQISTKIKEYGTIASNVLDETMTDTNLSSVSTPKTLVTALAVCYWLGIMGYGATYAIPRPQYTILFIGLGIIIYLLHEYSESEPQGLERYLLLILFLVVIVTTTYMTYFYPELAHDRSVVTYNYEYVMAGLFTVTIVYLSYKEFGLAFFGVIVFTLFYASFGEFFPGIFSHGGLSLERILDRLVMDISGFYGSISGIVAAWVSLFLLYAGLLRAYGAFDLILRGALRAENFVSSGVAQSAVIASMIIGSINGAATANAAMTGSFTIPMMKESGLPGRVAGAIESVASSGGQIMPPVMGAAAFVMASLLGITYTEVLIAGLIPAAVFFISVAIGVHFTSARFVDKMILDRDDHITEDKTRGDFIVDLVKFGVPFIILIYTLGVAQWTVMSAALFTCFLMIVTGVGIPVISSAISDGNMRSSMKDALDETIDGFRHGAIILAPIVIIVAMINTVVDLLMATGMPGTFSLAIMDLSGGVLLVAVLSAMGVCIILGMGMPTVAAYTLVAILIAPTFTSEFLISDLSAHYFVFYAAMLSGITPPIAVSVVVANGIAGANFWRTSFEALRLSATLFILPVTIIYNPEIVTDGISLQAILSAVIILGGAVSVTYGLNYPATKNMNTITGLALRSMFGILGVVGMTHPDIFIQTGAVVVSVVFIAIHQNSTEKGIEVANVAE